MKFRILFFFLLLSCGVFGQSAMPIPPKPAYPRLFNDEDAYAYYHAVWRRIEDKLIQHKKQTGNELVILTIPTTDGYSVDEMATAIFNQWGIGDPKQHTGLLLLVARKEKKIRIETGYGLEGQVPDITASAIINRILKPGLERFDFRMLPARADKGYLPFVEQTVDTLIRLTAAKNNEAVFNNHRRSHQQKTNKWIRATWILTVLILGAVLLRAAWRFANRKLSEIQSPALSPQAYRRRNRSKPSLHSQYIIPVCIIVAVFAGHYFFQWPWLIVSAVLFFLVLRWIYYLPSPKRKKEDIEWERQWYARKKQLKTEYKEKKKILGSQSAYTDSDAWYARYLELGMDKLEKELMVGLYTPKAAAKSKGSGIGSLLYDFFLGTSSVEKKHSFSSTQTKGYDGESTGGQSAGGFGGGNSGGGGASS